MTYVTDSMREALAEHQLRQVCNSGGVRVFRMAHPAGILAVDLIFMPEHILVSAGERRNLRSQFGCTLSWFVEPGRERDLCARFHDYDPSDAGWLCAIQRRFAEFWAERVARIGGIVAGWEWVEYETIWCLYTRRWTGESLASVTKWPTADPAGRWVAREEMGQAESVDAAKLAARAAVLRQAVENPGLWHCGEVDKW